MSYTPRLLRIQNGRLDGRKRLKEVILSLKPSEPGPLRSSHRGLLTTCSGSEMKVDAYFSPGTSLLAE
jgi:hypothetical protein